jgi:Putative beta-barrel porin-2, OmpL-like. bbp2
VIDPKANPFYSHSYIFNFGIPLKHLGVLGVWHASGLVDLYLGIDSGTNVTVGGGDNNERPGGIAGFGLNMLDGKLTVLALTHIGPEDSTLNTPFGNDAIRYYNDVVITYKYSDPLTLTTEFNYAKESGFRAEGYGVAQYAAYTLSDTLTLNGRAEIWRDNGNFFVSTPVNNLDFVNFERGLPANFYTASRPTTYSEITAGVTYKPANLPPVINNLMIRPEIRYDRTLNNSKPFDDSQDKGSVTLAADVILGF